MKSVNEIVGKRRVLDSDWLDLLDLLDILNRESARLVQETFSLQNKAFTLFGFVYVYPVEEMDDQ